MKSTRISVPPVWPSIPLFVPPYRYKEEGEDRRVIYALTESPQPPLSLQEAAAIGNINLVRTIIEDGTDLDSLDDSFLKTALHRAAISGHKDIVELLLAEGANIDPRDQGCVTPLHYAAKEGHKDVAELLIANGADVDATNNVGDTPLHSAARPGHKDIVELLIAKGANVNAKNTEGHTPKDIVARRTKPSVFFISVVVTPVVVGIVFAIPLVLSLRKVTGHPKRFFRYFALLIGVGFVEYLAVFAGITLGLTLGFVWALALVSGLASVWGVVFGLWLRGRSTARKVLKASLFVSLYASLPNVCLGIISPVLAIIEGESVISVEAVVDSPFQTFPWPLNTILGLSLALVLGTVLVKTVTIIGVAGLLIRFKSSKPVDKAVT